MPRRRRRPSGERPGPASVWDTLYPTLDLHGETAESARLRADCWLRERQRAGDPVARLITGRGLHSAGPPVLPSEIAHLLDSLRGTVVSSFQTEPGGGVYRVEVRPPAEPRPRRSTRPSTPAPSPDDPLYLEALEALTDLGITPTPELIATELRRLRSEREG